MKIALTLTALALSLTPAAASSPCAQGQVKEETAASCAPGTSWDPVKAICTATPSS